MSGADPNRALLDTWFQRVWNEGDALAIDELFLGDTKARGLGDQTLNGPEAFKEFHKRLNGIVSDINISVERSVSDGDWISARCIVNGKCPRSGKNIEFTGILYARVENGRLAEGYNEFNFMSLYEQLGFIPEKSFETCLAGKALI